MSAIGGEQGFLHDRDANARSWKEGPQGGMTPRLQWLGNGKDALAVCWATASNRPASTAVAALWRKRHGNAAPPVLLVVTHPDGAVLCGTSGDDPPIIDLGVGPAERIAATALDQPNRHNAARSLFSVFDTDDHDSAGIVNKGLFATHELLNGVPTRADWGDATEAGRTLLGRGDRDLIGALGYAIDASGVHEVLRDADDRAARAVAVFLQPGESANVASTQRGNATPVSWAMTHADRNNIPWVITVQGSVIRLYSTAISGAAGQRSRETTYTELNLAVLDDDRAGYLPLLFSAKALAPNGPANQIREASADYAADLAVSLRERVYDHVVPVLATAVANRSGVDPDLVAAYRTSLTILFRLLFLGYAEAQRLLPYRRNGEYTDASLSARARHLADAHNRGDDLGFDNPIDGTITDHPDTTQSDLWDTCSGLFRAVDKGHVRWGVPVYNGGLFSSDPAVNPAGATIEGMRLTNAEFGPALMALLIDDTADGDVGPIDFRSLSVREFGTIYEGLLESELAVAEQDLTLVRRRNDDVYEPTSSGTDVHVPEGEVYLHNASGARKASGSYFTRPFAVQHLIDSALTPTLNEHLDRVNALIKDGREADAADRLFDFRVVDVAMGSGHFLTAAVDAIEARVSAWLAEHPLSGVDIELQTLRNAAQSHLPEEQHDLIEDAALLRRLIARRCIYGVDLNPISVELARVSMWIHTFVAGLPLSFLNHNLQVGNSLTGLASLQEAIESLAKTSPTGTMSVLEEPLRNLLLAAEDPMRRLSRILDTTSSDIEAAREVAMEATEAVKPVADLFDSIVSARLGYTALPVVMTPEDLASAGTPETTTAARGVDALHFPVQFPEVFIRERPGFDVILGNPPWDKVQVLTDEFWARHLPGLQGIKPQAAKERTLARFAAQRPDLAAELEREKDRTAELQVILGASDYDIGGGNPDLCQMFAWRTSSLLRAGGRLGIVYPRGTVLSGDAMENWRRHILTTTSVDITLLLNNRNWVFDIHPQYGVALTTIQRTDSPVISLRGPFASKAAYDKGMQRSAVSLPVEEFLRFSDRAAFPSVNEPAELPVLRTMLAHPRIGKHPNFMLRAIQGDLNATTEKDAYVRADVQPADDFIPVISGASFDLWNPDKGEPYGWAQKDSIEQYLLDKWNRQVRNSKSAFHGLAASADPAVLPMARPRVAFRPNSNRTNSRTILACLVPGDVVLQNRAQFFYPLRATAVDEAYLLGVLSSRVFDWVARRFVETTVTLALIDDMPVPALQEAGRERIATIAGRLAAVDDRFTEWAGEVGVAVNSVSDAERGGLLAELDACVARAFGLDADALDVIYSTFHPTWDHRPFRDEVVNALRSLTFDPATVPA